MSELKPRELEIVEAIASEVSNRVLENMGIIRKKWTQGKLLSSRELQVMRLVANGMTDRSIGVKLGLSSSTVKNHVMSSVSKLNAHDRTHASTILTYWGYITPQGAKIK